LTIPQQQLLEWTAGKVFHDDLGLEAVRQRFAWYPRDVWLYLLASQWAQIAEIEAFVGRTWQLGESTGYTADCHADCREIDTLMFHDGT